MSLKSTNLLIQSAPLPATFKGGPNELFTEMIRRMKIVSPNGINFIFIGDTAPTSNVGPWLKDGTKWYVWDDAVKQYVPVDVSDSETKWFWIGNATPTSTAPPVWLQTTAAATDVNPNSFGTPVVWKVFDGTAWQPVGEVSISGGTADRPASPIERQKYFDTDINCELWFERGKWRTVSGVPGDVKFVTFDSLTAALLFNPGWNLLGATNPALLGRVLVGACKDTGASPDTVVNPSPGVTQRAAFDTFFETVTAGATTITPQLALWCLVKE